VRNSGLGLGYADTNIVQNLRWQSGLEIEYMRSAEKNVKIEKQRD
jgi:hypothetical protein